MSRCLCIWLLVGLTNVGVVTAAEWRPLPPEQLALKKSASDPDADAEGFFRDVRVKNEASTFGYPTNLITEYVRLKIFTDRGKEKYATVQLPYYGKSGISGVEGRTIQPDGTIVPLSRDAIFEKLVERGNGNRFKVVSFAMPAVAPGSIIEYRYNYDVGEQINRYLPLDVQEEYPIDLVDFHIKPVTGVYVSWPKMRYMPFGCHVEMGATGQDGFSELMVRNVPSFRSEPYMPPERAVKAWILIYYEEDDHTHQDAYWKAVGHQINGEYSKMVKVNGDVKALAAELTAGAKTDEEKLTKLAQYCQKNIKDIYGTQITTEEREKAKLNHTSADTLKQKEGTRTDIHFAFLALALASGFDARIARIADTEEFLFSPSFTSEYFLDRTAVAVNFNDKWKFYDVPDLNVAIGTLPWHEEGTAALLVNSKDSQFVNVPMQKADDSRVSRIANFTISTDGDLEGEVRELYFGHEADGLRERIVDQNDDQRAESIRRKLKQQFAEFEATDIKFKVSPDLSKGVSLTYNVKVKGYAQRTGKRLFLIPAYFEQGQSVRFTETTRKLPVYMRYPWSETDFVSIQLPAGYALDHADAPSPVSFGAMGKYQVQIAIDKSNKLTYNRIMIFGSDTLLWFEPKLYPTLKHVFEQVHTGDNHMLTLKADAQPAQGQ